MCCPRCQVPLRALQSHQVPFHACADCGGVWLDREAMNHVLREDCQSTVSLIDRVAARAVKETDPRSSGLPCPRCAQTMAARSMARDEVVVDVCPIHGWWFDRDELRACVAAHASHESHAPYARHAHHACTEAVIDSVSGIAEVAADGGFWEGFGGLLGGICEALGDLGS